MKTQIAGKLTALVAMTLLGTGAAFAQQAADGADFGRFLYMNNCAVCHGTTGKGEGPYGEFIGEIPGLTTLKKDNGGVFPIARVHDVIEGRVEIRTHGPRDMPVWGERFSLEAIETQPDVAFDNATYVQNRILHLIDYLYRIQE
jgi:mono/diheme cytochrome c family protein